MRDLPECGVARTYDPAGRPSAGGRHKQTRRGIYAFNSQLGFAVLIASVSIGASVAVASATAAAGPQHAGRIAGSAARDHEVRRTQLAQALGRAWLADDRDHLGPGRRPSARP
jgi:hypothetical protein